LFSAIGYKENMNKIESIEQYANVLVNILTTLSERGDIQIPCQNPQPWNDSTFQPTFEANAPRWTVPEWRFSCYPKFSRIENVMHFDGIQLAVSISNATMGGPSKTVMVRDPGEIAATLNILETFRQEALKKCRHFNHRFVANLGRCYNQYKCNDCGVTFNIDSGD
jgi:hypothetical protein